MATEEPTPDQKPQVGNKKSDREELIFFLERCLDETTQYYVTLENEKGQGHLDETREKATYFVECH